MIGYASNTGTKRNLAALRREGWRILLTPQHPVERDGIAYGIDNGAWSCFQQHKPFDGNAFMKLVDRAGEGADFLVLPDIVAGGMRSFEFSMFWLPQLKGLRRLLLPIQDGMTTDAVDGFLRDNLNGGVFLGGSTEYKLKTMYDWGIRACAARRWYHIGRVNTARRIRLAAEAGATSFDGTSATRYSKTLPLLEAARRQPSLLVPFFA